MRDNEKWPESPFPYQPAGDGIAGANPTVLIIEEYAALARTLVRVLEIEGYKVTTAVSVDEGIALMHRVRPSLVILDRRQVIPPSMKGKIGIAVEPATLPGPSLSLVPGHARTGAAVQPAASAYIVKPIGRTAQYDVVCSLLIRNGAVSPTIYRDPVDGVFSELVSRYRSFAEQLAFRNGIRRGLGVQEVVDDAFLALFKVLPQFLRSDDKSDFFRLDILDAELRSWFGATLSNLCLARRRAGMRHEEKLKKLVLKAAHDLLGGRLSDADKFELSDFLDRALQRLKPRDRTIVEERFYEDLEYEEIAARHKLSVSSVKRIIAAALKLLYSILSPRKR